jgi:hypothetical protein
MAAPETIHDASTLALQAMVWTLAEPARAERLLSLTGLTANDLRHSAGQPATLAAVLGFLEAHEPDLIACATEIGVKPEAIVAAHRKLEGDFEA